jgi:hypothetical protein
MVENCFFRIMDWPYHPRLIMLSGFLVSLYAGMSGSDAPLWAGLVASAFITPFMAVFLFIPYLITVVVLAALFSLLQAMRTKFHRPFPAAR